MRNVGLDILRIFAVLLVIGRHLHLPDNSPSVLRLWVTGGWVGVDLFFVLSGFLVSSLLFREYQRDGSVDIKRFLIRRGFKIYPAFWLFLLVSMMMNWYLGIYPGKKKVLGEIFFLQNYLGGIWNHTWSLAVEEHFYIGLAIMVTWLLTVGSVKPFHRLPLIFAVIASCCLLFRILNLFVFPVYSHEAYLFGTHIRIDSLMFGVFLSYLWNFSDFEKRIARIPAFLLVSIAVMLLSPAFVFPLETNKWISVFGVILFYVGSGFLLIAAVRWKTSDLLAVNLVAGLGAASYSIYLWHMPVAIWGNRVVSKIPGCDNYYAYMFNAVIGACVFGWILNRLIENPILSIRDRFFPPRSHAVNADKQSGAGKPPSTSDGNP